MKIIFSNKGCRKVTKYPSWYDDELISGTFSNISAYSDPEPSLEQPEIEGYRIGDENQYIYKELKDEIVNIDSSGNIEFEDTNWSNPVEDEGEGNRYYIEVMPGIGNVTLVTKDDIIYDSKKLITPYLPYKEGRYKLNGDLALNYNITNINVRDLDVDSMQYEYFTDEFEIEFNISDSYVENFEYEEEK